MKCRAYAVEKSTGDTLYGSWITMQMVKSEGWLNKDGSKWKTMPEHMFKYRSASFFVDEYAPELKQGIPTKEEVEDITPIEIINPIEEEIKENANKEVIGSDEKAENQTKVNATDGPTNEPAQPTVEKIEVVGEQEMPDVFKG